VFDREQYNRDLSAGLIELSRANPGVSNKSPYNPSDIKAAHNATSINIQPAAGKKRVTIAITIAYNWPADYLQSCLDAMCRVYGLTSRTIEVINLDTNGAKTDAVPATVSQVINPLKIYVGGSSNTSTSVTAIGSITEFVNASSGATNLDALGWLGELLLDLWAFAMNPNANIRIIGANDTSMGAMFNAVTYASTDSNFAASPNGTTDFVNMSWGGPAGLDFQSFDSIFSNPRICYLGATGDNRYSTYPATSSNVLAVGGTSLYYDAAANGVNKGPYNSVWVGTNAGVGVGAGGVGAGAGFAIDHARPAYQNNLAALTNYNNAPKRCTPDVSSVADSATGVLIFFTDGTSSSATKIMTQQLGGTSLASPILCGLFSHLVQKAYNDNLATMTTVLTNGTSMQLQTLLYTKYASSGVVAANMFYDVVDGTLNLPTNNALGDNNSGATFAAATGYDIASGLGFPLFQGILNAIYPGEPANIGGNGATIIASNNPLAINRKVIFNINL
jgi:hypothetical protein